MSNWKGHIIFGLIFTILIAVILSYTKYSLNFNKIITQWHDLLFFIPLLLFFTLVPDLDIQSSKPRMLATIIMLSFLIYYLFINKTVAIIIAVILLLIWIVPVILSKWSHRGHMHSVIFIFLLSLTMFYFNIWWIPIMFLAGLSHILADKMFKLW